MIESQIIIDLKECSTKKQHEPSSRYQEWVARFCYAAASMPPEIVEEILGLMELRAEHSQNDREQ